jgi:hypothetical protein
MADTNMIDKEQTETPASGAKTYFPRIALNKVLELSEKIYELGQGDTVPRLVVFDGLGKSASSGPSRMLVTTSNGYGLTTGNYNAPRLGLTDAGKDITSTTDTAQKSAKLADLMLKEGTLFQKFYSYYTDKNVPVEAMAVDFLKREGGLKDEDAKVAFDVFMTNLRDFGFTKELSGKETIVSRELVDLPMIQTMTQPVNATSQPTLTMQAPSEVQPQAGSTAAAMHLASTMTTVPQFNFNIQIELPNDSSPETYDAIFRSISEHLLSKDNARTDQ